MRRDLKPFLLSIICQVCFLFSFLFTSSCAGIARPAERPFSGNEDSAYCELLHLPFTEPSVIHERPWLGIYLASGKSDVAVSGCPEDLFILAEGVIKGSPADEAGMETGDLILSLGNALTCLYQEDIVKSFRKMIEEKEIGSEAVMKVLRNGQEITLTARLKKMPLLDQPEAAHEFSLCSGPSALENRLRAQDSLEIFNLLISGLHRQTNRIHNPGAFPEEDSAALQLRETAYLMRHPLAAGAVAKKITGQLVSSAENSAWSLPDMLRRTAGLLDIEIADPEKKYEITFTGLLQALEDTKNRVEEVLSGFEPEERAFLLEKALNPRLEEEWNAILHLSMKLNRRELFSAFSPLLSFLARDNLLLLKEDIAEQFGDRQTAVLHQAMTPAGPVIIGGYGPNVYDTDAALILDLGGDDLYRNNAGGTRPGMPVALVIDWEGNDRYVTKESFSQGAGVLGGGFLLDLAGNDTFISLDGSQGAGFFGLGFLYHGPGRSVYRSRSFSQGVGQMGIGLLLNRGSDDLYLSSHHGQGLGNFGGAGLLIDLEGDDYYSLGGSEPDFRDPSRSTVSLGQGFGLGSRPDKGAKGVPGGIGILLDRDGDDTYLADYFAQGASYYHGIGILNDRNGDDRYIAGRYAQGAGIHSSVGVLLDQAGDDFYYSSFGVAQGTGHDYGVGFLEDEQGDDHFWGGTLVQGAATNGSLGILIDSRGDNSYMHLTNGHGFTDEPDALGIVIKPGTADEKVTIRLGIKSGGR